MEWKQIILAAHGAGDGSGANETARALAGRIAELTGVPAGAAFNLGTPTFEEAVARVGAGRALVVPLMLADGYFARRVLRERVERAAAAVGASITYSRPVGTLGVVQERIVARLGSSIARSGAEPRSVAVVVVGHGTRRDSNSPRSARELADRVRTRLAPSTVVAAFLDQEPHIEEVVSGLEEPVVAVVPFLLGGGGHALDDVPRRVNDSLIGRGSRVLIEPPVGDDEGLAAVLAEHVRSLGRREEVRLGTRGSELARFQAEQARAMMESAGFAVRLVSIESTGDSLTGVPIEELPGAAPFTDDLNRALVEGRVDATTHSMKDLPLGPEPRVVTIAHLPRADAGEALVARGGLTLAELPAGARIGTSCGRRTGQLLAWRPDLRPMPMRGAVDDRVEQVRRGDFEGAILAVAGLERLGLDDAITERFTTEAFAPAPAQGAIVVQVRAEEAERFAALGARDDLPTRRAVRAELAFAKEIEGAGYAAAAHATVDAAGRIRLFGRLIGPGAEPLCDLEEVGSAPTALGRSVARRLLESLGVEIGGGA